MSNFIDSVELTICMSKSEGILPDLTGKTASEIKKSLILSVDINSLKDFGFTHYRIINDGGKSKSLCISDGHISGYPTLKVRIYSYPDMDNVKCSSVEDKILLSECFSYKLDIGTGSDFFFIDANGYTDTMRVTAEMKPPEFFDEKIRHKCVQL
jgi:hypothetical protein